MKSEESKSFNLIKANPEINLKYSGGGFVISAEAAAWPGCLIYPSIEVDEVCVTHRRGLSSGRTIDHFINTSHAGGGGVIVMTLIVKY